MINIEQQQTVIRKISFDYNGMNQRLIESLRFDTSFEKDLAKLLHGYKIGPSVSLLLTKQGKSGEAPEGISLISYNRFSVQIAYAEKSVFLLGTVYIQIACRANSGESELLFNTLKNLGLSGGELGCTSETEKTFIVRRSLASNHEPREVAKQKSIYTKYVSSINSSADKEAADKISIEEVIHQAAYILNLSEMKRRLMLGGGISVKSIKRIVEGLSQIGERTLAIMLAKAFL